MNGDLIAITFPQEDGAFRARQALGIMRGRHLLGLEKVVLATKDKAGRTTVYQQWDLPAFPRDRQRYIPVLFADALFGVASDEGAQEMVDAGLDEVFVTEVAKALDPDGSALLIYIPPDSIVDTRRLLDTLALFDGKLHHTTMPAAVERAILAQVEVE